MFGSREPSPSNNHPNVGDIKLENLFESSRIQIWPKYYKAVLYAPFLLCLLLVRLITATIGLFVLSLLPRTSQKRNAFFKALCRISGFIIEVDAKNIDDNAKILVANHLSILDRLAVNAMVPCSTITTDYRITTVNSLSFWKDIDIRYSRDITDDEIWTLQRSIEDSPLPLLHFPEGATTNAKVGLLKFHPGVFSINVAIQPVIIEVSFSSFMRISSSVLGSAVWADLFWFLLLPSTKFTLRTLPSMEKLPNESAEDFSIRVQSAMASALKLKTTIHTSSDKLELTKRLQISNIPSSSKVSQTNNPIEFLHKTQDLLRTPQQKPTMNTAAETFGKTPKERMASYRDRRALLVEAARQKYLEKHSP